MLQSIVEISDQINRTLVYNRERTSVLLIGSASPMGGMEYSRLFSDVDLLIIPHCRSLKDYVNNIEQAMRMAEDLNKSDSELIDVFMLTNEVAGLHFLCLSVLAGAHRLESKDVIFGTYYQEDRPLLNDSFCKEIYKAKALAMIQACQQQLPVADTAKARKVSKLLLRTLKVVLCAYDSEVEVSKIEKELFVVKKFSTLSQEINTVSDITLSIDSIVQDVLEGKTIDDWPAWMIAQEKIVYWFMKSEADIEKQDEISRRFYDGVCEVRDMLMLGLKDVIVEGNNTVRSAMIGEYTDKTASVIVKLGLSKVPSLLDFTTPETPVKVRESYNILVNHLKLSQPSLDCLAASVIILEYAFKQSVHVEMEMV